MRKVFLQSKEQEDGTVVTSLIAVDNGDVVFQTSSKPPKRQSPMRYSMGSAAAARRAVTQFLLNNLDMELTDET